MQYIGKVEFIEAKFEDLSAKSAHRGIINVTYPPAIDPEMKLFYSSFRSVLLPSSFLKLSVIVNTLNTGKNIWIRIYTIYLQCIIRGNSDHGRDKTFEEASNLHKVIQ